MARAINAETLSLLEQWEGFKAKAYPDPGSRDGTPWTIGYGQTSIHGRRCARATRAPAVVERLVKVEITDNQFGALVSFTYNIGDDAFANSPLLKKLNADDYKAVPAQLARWNKSDGKVMEGLTNRRAAKAGL
jgi:lysozyme